MFTDLQPSPLLNVFLCLLLASGYFCLLSLACLLLLLFILSSVTGAEIMIKVPPRLRKCICHIISRSRCRKIRSSKSIFVYMRKWNHGKIPWYVKEFLRSLKSKMLTTCGHASRFAKINGSSSCFLDGTSYLIYYRFLLFLFCPYISDQWKMCINQNSSNVPYTNCLILAELEAVNIIKKIIKIGKNSVKIGITFTIIG